MDHIQFNLNLDRPQLDKVQAMVSSNPKLFATSEILKHNRTMSYLTFVLKDIKDFLLAKTDEGLYFEEVRNAGRRLESKP